MKYLTPLVLMVNVLATVQASEETLRLAILSEPLSLKPRTHRVTTPPPKEKPTPLTLPISLYRCVFSSQDGERCTFSPSCSAFALEAIREEPLFGWIRLSERLLRCHAGNEEEYPIHEGRKENPFSAERNRTLLPTRAAMGTFLSLVPGLGQILSGKKSDGVYALKTIAFFSLGAYAYSRRGERTKALLAGSVAGFFYVGNLYGGARAFSAQ